MALLFCLSNFRFFPGSLTDLTGQLTMRLCNLLIIQIKTLVAKLICHDVNFSGLKKNKTAQLLPDLKRPASMAHLVGEHRTLPLEDLSCLYSSSKTLVDSWLLGKMLACKQVVYPCIFSMIMSDNHVLYSEKGKNK